METKDLIPVVAIGGALGLIVYLASKNQNKADEVYMPYGWGSFQGSNNPVTPIPPGNPPGAPTDPKPDPIPPNPIKGWIEPWNGAPWNGDWQNYLRFNGDWEAYQEWLRDGDPVTLGNPNPIKSKPVVDKQTNKFEPLSIKATQQIIKPVTGAKVLI